MHVTAPGALRTHSVGPPSLVLRAPSGFSGRAGYLCTHPSSNFVTCSHTVTAMKGINRTKAHVMLESCDADKAVVSQMQRLRDQEQREVSFQVRRQTAQPLLSICRISRKTARLKRSSVCTWALQRCCYATFLMGRAAVIRLVELNVSGSWGNIYIYTFLSFSRVIFQWNPRW